MTVFIWDGATARSEDWTWTWYSDRNPESSGAGNYQLSDRHNEGLNVGFYDGHAKWWKFQQCWVTNAGAPIPMTTQPGNRTVVGPNPFFTASGES